MAVDSEQIDVWTDGACTGNPGPGGWGAILVWRGIEKEISGGEADTTNNRMELMAAIQALEALHRTVNVHIRTDSQYVLKGITQWMVNWKRNGWKTKAGQPVKNADLWQRLDAVCARLPVEWTWVKGHAGNVMNEKADELAREAIPKGKTI